MPLKTLMEIKAEIKRLAALIDAPAKYLPGYGDGYRYVYIDWQGYHYVEEDRGNRLKWITTMDPDFLLYNAFVDVTYYMASDYTQENRVEGEDHRRMLFARQEYLLSELSPKWGRLQAEEHERILTRFPYDDLSCKRVEFCQGLQEKGYPPEEAWALGIKEYPFPEPNEW